MTSTLRRPRASRPRRRRACRRPNRKARTGKAWKVADLAEQYGFTDLDGRIPRAD